VLTSLDPDCAEALIPQAEIEKNLVEIVFLSMFSFEFFGKCIALGLVRYARTRVEREREREREI